jgi:hypothetical protein
MALIILFYKFSKSEFLEIRRIAPVYPRITDLFQFTRDHPYFCTANTNQIFNPNMVSVSEEKFTFMLL